MSQSSASTNGYGAEQFLTHDGAESGPTRDYWNPVLGLKWKRGTMGDWLDSSQIANGPTPYVTSSSISGVERKTVVVTSLVSRWLTNGQNRGFYLKATGNVWPVFFAGRTYATAGDRPELTVVTSTGTFNLPCLANACYDTSTFNGGSSSGTFRLAVGTAPGFLRFSLQTVTGTIVSASLAFSVSSLTQAGASVQIFEADPPTFVVPDTVTNPVLGISSPLTTFQQLASQPSVLFSDDCAVPGWVNDSAWQATPERILNPTTNTTLARGTFVSGQNLGVSARADVTNGTGVNGVPNAVHEELFGQYHMYLDSDWGSTVDAIKIPAMGVQFGYWNAVGYWQSTTGNGGSPGTGLKVWNAAQSKWEYQGHSIRFLSSMKATDGSPYEDLFGLAIYPYNLDQIGPFPAGENFDYVCLRRERWYCIDIRVKQNSVTGPFDGDGNGEAVADGVYEVWINGYPSYSRTNYRWRKHPEFGVQGVWLDFYHGGTQPAPYPMHFLADRVSVGTSYIGPSSFAKKFTLTPPATLSGYVGIASQTWTLVADGSIGGTVTVTLSDNGGGGVFSSSTLSFNSSNLTRTFTYTPGSAGAKQITMTNNGYIVNPQATTYTASVSVYPTWRQGMTPFTWKTIPTTNTLSAIDPTTNPAITPPGADFVGRGMTLGLLSWTGGVWDDQTGTFWIPIGGGHTDYGGNEPYRIQINSNSPSWVMVRNPTGAVGNTGVTRDGLEETGVYFDGRIRAAHSYNNQTFVPGLGPVISRSAGVFYAPGGGDSVGNNKAYWLNSAGEANLIVDHAAVTAASLALSQSDGVCAYDPTRGAQGTIWTMGHGDAVMVRIDIAAQTAVAVGPRDNHFVTSDAMHYIPSMDVLAGITRGVLKIWRIDQGNFTPVTPTLSGSYSSGLDLTYFSGFGSCWVPELNCLALFENKLNNRIEISTLTPTGTASDPWVRGVLNVDVSNVVVPPALGGDGLFGRFGYSSLLKGFYLVPNTTSQPLFFAIE